MELLLANLRDRDLTPAMVEVRGDSYRRRLDHLGDEHWLYVVDLALDRHDWFPTIHELLDIADETARRCVALVPQKSDEEREREREEAKATYRRVREHLVAVGLAEPLALASMTPTGLERPFVTSTGLMSDDEWAKRKRDQLARLQQSGEGRTDGEPAA
jgi:hypothetical protein